MQAVTISLTEVNQVKRLVSLVEHAVDVVLVKGRPDKKITDTVNIKQVWID